MLPDRSLYIGQKFVENAKIEKAQMRHFRWFSNIVSEFSLDDAVGLQNRNGKSGKGKDFLGIHN